CLAITDQPPEPTGAGRGRPRQTESRSEVFVVGFDFMPHQELRRIESREGRIGQDVRRLAEVLISQAQSQSERGRQLPVVLKKISLAKLGWMKHRHAESTHEVAGGPAKIVQEVSERRIAHRIGEVDGSKVVSCARLGCGLAQKLHSIAKRVTAP